MKTRWTERTESEEYSLGEKKVNVGKILYVYTFNMQIRQIIKGKKNMEADSQMTQVFKLVYKNFKKYMIKVIIQDEL